MKKIVLVGLAIVIAAGTAWAGSDSFTNYPGTLSAWGYPGITKTVYIDNTAKTFQQHYERSGGTWLGGYDGTITPIGVFITCATTDTKWAFGGATPSATLGHVFPAGSSWHLVNPFYISTGKGFGNAATDNVTCQLTPEY
jgi:hypothetical protein